MPLLCLTVFAVPLRAETGKSDGTVDLVVSGISAPAVSGTSNFFFAKVVVHNVGQSDANSPFSVSLFLSSDQNVTTNDLKLGSKTVSDLAAGAGKSVQFGVTIDPQFPTGTYYFGAIVDETDAIHEANEANNALTVGSISIVVGPDVESLSVQGPSAAVTGEFINITNAVQNAGTGNPGDFVVGFYLSQDATITTNDLRIGAETIPGMAPGVGQTRVTVVRTPGGLPPGTYYIGAIADDVGALTEVSKANNSSTGNSIVIAVGSDLSVETVGGPSRTVSAGVIFVTNTIRYTGMTDLAAPIRVGIYLSTNATVTTEDVLIGSRTVAGLASGQTSTEITRIQLPIEEPKPGSYLLGVIVDDQARINETDEANNAWSVPIEVQIGVDVTMTSVAGPAMAGTGGSILVTNTILNMGVGLAGPSTVGLFLSTDPAITTNDLRIASRSFFQALAPGQSSTDHTVVKLPSNLTPGTYYLGAIANVNKTTRETDYSNNSALGNTIEITVGPDLAAAEVRGPDHVATTGFLTVTNTIQNLGTGDPGSFGVGIYLSADSIVTTNDLRLAGQVVTGLVAGASQTFNTMVSIGADIPPGVYYLGAIVDDAHAVTETTKANNARTGNQITVMSGPDLIVSSVSGPSTAVTSGSIFVTNTVMNAGASDLDLPIRVGFYLSSSPIISTNDHLVGIRAIPAGLAAGQSNTENTFITLIPGDLAPGTYYVGVIADFEGLLAETDKGNNSRTSPPIAVTLGPDLRVASLSGPAMASSGGSILITNTIANNGAGTAYGFVVGFYLSVDQTMTNNDYRVGTRGVSSLAAHTSETATTLVPLPTQLPPGSYYLRAIVDIYNTIVESNEVNNVLTGNSVGIVVGPDLMVTALSGPVTAATAGSLNLTSVLQNVGTGLAGEFNIGFYLSTDATITSNDLRIGSRTVSGPLPGEKTTNTIQVTLGGSVPAGNYYLGAIADDSGVVAEASEANNAFTGPPITIVTGPDLVVTSVAGPARALIGGGFIVTNTIRNAGMTDVTNPFRVGIYLSTDRTITTDDALLATRNVPGLAAGQSQSDNTTVFLTPEVANGTYFIGVLVDYEQVVAESDESNNGQVTNPVAFSPSEITGLRFQGADIVISFSTLAFRKYRVEQAETLSDDTTWTTWPEAANVAGTGAIVTVIQPGGASSGARYYRVRRLW